MTHPIVKRLGGLLLVVGLTLGLCEAIFRGGIHLGFSWFRDPGHYADWTSDDDYWKLRHLWQRKVAPSTEDVLDPFLGWSPNRTADNPLGIIGTHPKAIDYDGTPILLYGDSFIQGKGAWGERLSGRLKTELGGAPVYNLGVRGYGLDQMVLKFQQTHYRFKQPKIIVGILSVDLDRSVLKFRTGQKPRFVVAGSDLTLAGLPIDSFPNRWLAQNPPQIKSYFLAFVKRHWALWKAPNELELEYRRDEKKAVNSKIFDLLVSEAHARKLPIAFILFYNQTELTYEGWREKYLKAEMERLKVPFIDSKKVLVDESTHSKKPIGSWYDSEGHLSSDGNRLVAKEVARFARSQGWVRQSAPAALPGSSVSVSP